MKRSIVVMVMLGVLMVLGRAEGAFQPGEEGSLCLGCHANKGFSVKLKTGEELPLYVEGKALGASAHKDLTCTNCHSGYSISDHPQGKYKSRRAFTVAVSDACRKCHSFKEGIHQRMLASLKEIVCADCHGSHEIQKVQEGADTCYGCHRYRLTMAFTDGQEESLQIHEEMLKGSVHSRLRCADCHFGFTSKEHPRRGFANKRDFTIVSTEICRRCHFDKYTKTLESIHFNLLTRGNLKAPVCVDCHGAHSVTSGRQEKVRSARKCQQCHPAIYETYANSVHGKALLSDNNQDVPVCSDCHRAHDIADPRMTDFRNNIPQMCGNCHANKKLMSKYGLSTAVLESYLEDFHGVTLTFYKKQDKPVRHIAVCIDCHGIHDITRVKGPNATVLKANLAKRCQKCHPGATENFPDSWISHYEPNFRRAPLVYAINAVYSVFIPFMIVGLVLQIILHIWRYAVNR